MNRLKRMRPSSGQAALVVSVIALVFAIVGTAFSGGSKVPGKNGVKASDIAKGAVRNAKIADGAVTQTKIGNGAVTGAKIADGAIPDRFFLSTATTLNFDTILAEACASTTVPAPGIAATDHVLVTPPPGFPDTFNLQGGPEPATDVVNLAACNTFTAGGADPDGVSGGLYKVLVIR
jgi:hypothetical protein